MVSKIYGGKKLIYFPFLRVTDRGRLVYDVYHRFVEKEMGIDLFILMRGLLSPNDMQDAMDRAHAAKVQYS